MRQIRSLRNAASAASARKVISSFNTGVTIELFRSGRSCPEFFSTKTFIHPVPLHG
jgi:hypothetical protein